MSDWRPKNGNSNTVRFSYAFGSITGFGLADMFIYAMRRFFKITNSYFCSFSFVYSAHLK